ncbi:methyl-accepting chemotaxis protein [Thermincola potens]|uniref:Methyl-accepting chemotaxis sensory transducer n=1 Tax=Thermincola potens (strain JR) TaxID=635013 RepID=D5X9D6_THEPJ|nr:methyl-accepting chemotaxis protein [Thermincola potens]ADG83040.1 methyl-accepting chemotaxis sensory transducer [Thermincola potens JR]
MLKRSFGLKLVVVFVIMLFFVATGVGLYALNNMDDQMKALISEKLMSDMATGSELLEVIYPGDWYVRGGNLYKGDLQIASDFPFVTKLAKLTGDTVQLYFRGQLLAGSTGDVSKEGFGGQELERLARSTRAGLESIADNQVGVRPIVTKSGEQVGFWIVTVPANRHKVMIRNLQIKMMAGAYFALFVTSFIFYMITRIISKPINQIVDGMTKAEKGDLSVKLDIDTQDEFSFLGEKFNSMIDHIGVLVNNIVTIAEKVANHADTLNFGAAESSKITEQIAQTVQMVATGTEDQSKSIEQTSLTINEMSKGIQQVAGNSQNVLNASHEANEAALKGGKAVENAIKQMASISTTVNNSALTVKALGERSQQIGYIVDIITGIAKQTNLLALNAAIEAARAGEQGRGFAVVAEEVRKLAEQSGEAAKQIADLVKEIQEDTEQAVQAMESGLQEVANGTVAVNNAGEAFKNIMNTISKVVDQIQEVSVAAEEMAAAAGQAVAAIQNVASISEETAASAQQVAAAAEEQTASVEETAASASVLADLANELRESVSRFKV